MCRDRVSWRKSDVDHRALSFVSRSLPGARAPAEPFPPSLRRKETGNHPETICQAVQVLFSSYPVPKQHQKKPEKQPKTQNNTKNQAKPPTPQPGGEAPLILCHPLTRVGRCAGRNPPSVLSGIQLYGLPGSSRRRSSDPYSPFHPAGSAVSPKPVASSASKASKHATEGLVSVRCQGSPPTPHSVAVLHGGWSFLRP